MDQIPLFFYTSSPLDLALLIFHYTEEAVSWKLGAYTCIHTHAQYTHTHTCSHIHMLTYTCSHISTHTYTCSHTHAHMRWFWIFSSVYLPASEQQLLFVSVVQLFVRFNLSTFVLTLIIFIKHSLFVLHSSRCPGIFKFNFPSNSELDIIILVSEIREYGTQRANLLLWNRNS